MVRRRTIPAAAVTGPAPAAWSGRNWCCRRRRRLHGDVATPGTLHVSPLMAGKASMLSDFISAQPAQHRADDRRRAGQQPLQELGRASGRAQGRARHDLRRPGRQRHAQPHRHPAPAGEREGLLQHRSLSRLGRRPERRAGRTDQSLCRPALELAAASAGWQAARAGRRRRQAGARAAKCAEPGRGRRRRSSIR